MARNPNYLQMVEMGEWLEKLLAPKVENWELKELFKKAVKLLNLDYQVNHNHPFFLNLTELTDRNENWSSAWHYWLRMESSQDGNPNDAKSISANDTQLKLFMVIDLVRLVFKSVFDSGQPWNLVIADILKQNPKPALDKVKSDIEALLDHSVGNFTAQVKDNEDLREKARDLEDCHFKSFNHQGCRVFDRLYSSIGEKLILTEGGYKKVNVLLTCATDGGITSVKTTLENQPLPFPIFISRIFFDFLMFGGQEYYNYCSSCGVFIISQRKGRRKTCSGPCRSERYLNHK